jgi:transposase InsO family protein
LKVFYLFRGLRGYNRAMLRIEEIGDHPQREEIERRLKAIYLLDRGLKDELKMVFGVSRATVYGWKKRLKAGGNQVHALAPSNRAPKRRRQRAIDARLVEFIRKYRVQRPGIGKVIIKSELDRFCQERGLVTISESSVGRVLGDLKATGRLPDLGVWFKVLGGDGRLVSRRQKPKRTKKRRNGYQPREPGDLVQIDSLAVFRDRTKRYLLTAIDVNSRFGFAYCYPHLNSQNASDFLKKLTRVAPFTIKHIQTDNGHEFDKHFVNAIRASPITHFNTYPRHPQSNAHIERFNRTLRSQFLEHYEDVIDDVQSLNQALIDYLVWYNTRKPHQGIGKIAPLEYYVQSARLNRHQSNMLWTSTGDCILAGDLL